MKKKDIQYIKGDKLKHFVKVNDPYIPKGSKHEMSICKGCHAIYKGKKWFIDEELYKTNIKRKTASVVTCPACLKIKDNFPSGVVTLEGGFLKNHEDEILNLVRNEGDRSLRDNPLERIMSINKNKGRIEILTTNEKLAQKIGKSVFKAYSGELEYKWSEDDKFVRVNWNR
ncbi:MAG: BCAM0308 family protein [Nitrospinota bacterium]|jgi:NMD protein affecting ribosome stability and mRNA decay